MPRSVFKGSHMVRDATQQPFKTNPLEAVRTLDILGKHMIYD